MGVLAPMKSSPFLGAAWADLFVNVNQLEPESLCCVVTFCASYKRTGILDFALAQVLAVGFTTCCAAMYKCSRSFFTRPSYYPQNESLGHAVVSEKI